jgi:Mycothiol maleylpyruvate isomerase N-terminal domain
MDPIERSAEAEAFLDARQYTAPDVLSACEGWTAHEVTAHLAATAAEITRHLQPYLHGEAIPQTRSFEEREPAYRELSNAALLVRLESEDVSMRAVLAQVLRKEPNAVITWTGRQMSVAKFLPHMRNEYAIHRWDFVGDDDTSTQLLSQPELTAHAVNVLGEILLRRGRKTDPSPDQDFHVRLRATDTDGPDIRVAIDSGQAGLHEAGEQDDDPHVEMDAAARTLFIWGRRPDHRGRIRSHLDQPTLNRLQMLLAGY